MQSKAATVAEYLAALPEDRRAIIQALREVIRKNLDKDFAEGMQYGMIGYFVPHSVFPAGYHCDPKQPLPYAGLASQKQACSLYMMALYTGGGPAHDHLKWFQSAWADAVKAGRAKKLDMGKACIRFKNLEDIPLDVIAEAFRRVPAKTYIERYTSSLGTRATPAAKTATKKAPASTAKKAASKPAKQAVKKPAKPTAKRAKPATASKPARAAAASTSRAR